MKVRFSSRKESRPTEDRGLKVLYAPGKRAAFRLRWYLILLLVATPFLWFIGRIVWAMIIVDAPGQVVQPAVEIRALEPGRVLKLHVEEHERIQVGDPLLQLDKPALRSELAALPLPLAGNGADQAGQRQSASLERRLERARVRVQNLAELVEQGVATQGELEAAKNELDARANELAALERNDSATKTERFAFNVRVQRQRAVLEQRLSQLGMHAPVTGTVSSISVVEGENVGSGTILMTLDPEDQARIHLYLDTEQIHLATAGQKLTLRFPDGERVRARIAGPPLDVQRRPPALREAFGGEAQSLLVAAIPEEPIPKRWQVNDAPVTARFPSALYQWFH